MEKTIIESKLNVVGRAVLLVNMLLMMVMTIVFFAGLISGILFEINMMLGAGFFVLTIIATTMYFAFARSKLTITSSAVKGKGLFGREVYLPIDMVSSYSTAAIFSTISVASASGVTKFYMISNNREIGEVLETLIQNRQSCSINFSKVENQSGTSNLDDLKKLKELLDAGIISEDEFANKKKQILGV